MSTTAALAWVADIYVDGQLRLLGPFPLSNQDETLLLWSHQQLEPDGATVCVMQLYELYDLDGRLTEKRTLDVRFRLIDFRAFESLVTAA